jgi:two-component system sensor histidine kinase EvgS
MRWCRPLRENDATLPIIAMTANAMPEEKQRCLASGMDGFVAKPVRLDALRDALAAVTDAGAVWDLDALREDFGGLAALPRMVSRFAAATYADIDDAGNLGSPEDAAAWSHRIGGGLRVFGPSRAATMLERFERELRGEDAGAALQRLPSVVTALQSHVERLIESARELSTD